MIALRFDKRIMQLTNHFVRNHMMMQFDIIFSVPASACTLMKGCAIHITEVPASDHLRVEMFWKTASNFGATFELKL